MAQDLFALLGEQLLPTIGELARERHRQHTVVEQLETHAKTVHNAIE